MKTQHLTWVQQGLTSTCCSTLITGFNSQTSLVKYLHYYSWFTHENTVSENWRDSPLDTLTNTSSRSQGVKNSTTSTVSVSVVPNDYIPLFTAKSGSHSDVNGNQARSSTPF